MHMTDCLFCRIVAGESPSTRVYEDDLVFAFEDINPQAPVHVIIVPRKHIPTLNDLADGDDPAVARLVRAAVTIARERGIAEAGYRTVSNVNGDGRQTVSHVHLHLVGGKQLGTALG
jgi:histidine triad (HIT) family protein